MRTLHTCTQRLVTAVLTATLMSGSLAWAGGPNDKREARAREAIHALMAQQDAPVEVTLANGRTHQGWLQPLGRRSFLIVDDAGQKTQIRYSQVMQSRNLSTGKIVAAAGVAAGVALMMWCSKTVGNAICLPGQE
jgi:hypothetical protein